MNFGCVIFSSEHFPPMKFGCVIFSYEHFPPIVEILGVWYFSYEHFPPDSLDFGVLDILDSRVC